MKKQHFTVNRKSVFIVVTAVVLWLAVLPIPAGEKSKVLSGIRQQVLNTLRQRVELLTQLVADYEKQYKNGSLDGDRALDALMEWYEAKILLMKAEAGRPLEPGVAVAMLRAFLLARHAREMEKLYSYGQLALSSLLNVRLKANEANLKYLRLLQSHKYNAARLQTASETLRNWKSEVPLDDPFLRSLLEAEE